MGLINFLCRLSSDERVELIQGIPPHVSSLLLDISQLYKLDAAELAEVIKGIPATVTSVTLFGNKLFRNKTRDEIDDLLTKISAAADGRDIDLRFNGESDMQRALPALACLKRRRLDKDGQYATPLPSSGVETISSYLINKTTTPTQIHGMFSTTTMQSVEQKAMAENSETIDIAPTG